MIDEAGSACRACKVARKTPRKHITAKRSNRRRLVAKNQAFADLAAVAA